MKSHNLNGENYSVHHKIPFGSLKQLVALVSFIFCILACLNFVFLLSIIFIFFHFILKELVFRKSQKKLC